MIAIIYITYRIPEEREVGNVMIIAIYTFEYAMTSDAEIT